MKRRIWNSTNKKMETRYFNSTKSNKTVSKTTACPTCKKFGLQRKRNSKGTLKIRCKECNDMFFNKDAEKLSKLMDTNHRKAVIKSNKKYHAQKNKK